MPDARESAYRSLLRIAREGRFSNLEVDATLKRASLPPPERALYTRLVYGVIERTVTLDYFIAHSASRDPASLDLPLRILLRLGLLQCAFLRVPTHAAVSETVSLAKRVFPRGAGMVNAVLRRYLREGPPALPDESENPAGAFSVRYSVSEDLARDLLADYGIDKARGILAATKEIPPLTLRVNTLRTTRDELLSSLQKAGYDAIPTKLSPDCIALRGGAVSELAPLREGLCFVQDEASALCATALGAAPGETVIDTCAAPGGKSFSLAMAMGNRGRIFAFDLHENKLSLLRREAEKLGISIITAASRDAREPDPALLGRADRVLCDLPCSGSGVLAKKPDLRYRTREQMSRLPALQGQILAASADLLRPGGVLLASTCSLRREENERVVDAFLAARPDFSPEPFALSPSLAAPEGRVTLTPDETHTDGFFLAKLRRDK